MPSLITEQRMITERNAEKSAINKEHQKQMQIIARDHKKELDVSLDSQNPLSIYAPK
jgi:hypothetical protein